MAKPELFTLMAEFDTIGEASRIAWEMRRRGHRIKLRYNPHSKRFEVWVQI